IAVINGQVHVFVAVKRQLHAVIGAVAPPLATFLAVIVSGQGRARFTLGRRIIRTRVQWWRIRYILQVRLAYQCRAPARLTQYIDKSAGVQWQRNPVVTSTVQRGHATGHQGSTVGHADGGSDVKSISTPTASC